LTEQLIKEKRRQIEKMRQAVTIERQKLDSLHKTTERVNILDESISQNQSV